MPISFDAWKNKNAGAALITQERNELLTSFSGGAQRVADNLWTAGEKNLANQFSDFVSKSLYIKYDPAEVEEAGQAEELRNGINTLGKLSAFLDEEAENGKTNFQILMEQGTQGDDPAFGTDGKLFFEWLKTLNDTFEIGIDVEKFTEQYAQIRAEAQATRNVQDFANQEIAPEEPPVQQHAAEVPAAQPQPANVAANVPGEERLNNSRELASELYAQIKSVDFNLLGKGSPEFREMKLALKELRDYARDHMSPDENNTIQTQARYHDIQSKAIKCVEKYLDHKHEEMLKDPTRKNDKSKQKNEQPRIKTSIEILEKLKKSYAIGQRRVINTIRGQEIKKMTDMLNAQQQIRNSITATDDNAHEQYMQSVNITMRITENLDGAKWSLNPGESLESFTKRVAKYADSDTYSDLPTDDYKKPLRASHNAMLEASRAFKGIGGYNAGTHFSTEKLEQLYKERCKSDYTRAFKNYAEDAAKKAAEQGTKDYRNDLLSDKTLNNIWDDERYAENYAATGLVRNVYGSLPGALRNDVAFFPEGDDEFDDLVDNEMMNGSQLTRKNILKTKNNYSANDDRVIMENGHRFDPFCYSLEPVLNGIKNYHKRVAEAAKEAAKRAEDEKVKRFYEDKAELLNHKSTDFMHTMETTPYLTTLLSQSVTGFTPHDINMEEARKELGNELVDAALNFNHAIMTEIKTAVKKQKIKNKGMTPEEEKQYLKELYKTHDELLKHYERLDGFQDDAATKKYFGNPLAHDFGRGSKADYRPIVSSVGMINGEKRAIENNWGADELAVLSMLGCIEANLDRLEKYGTPKQKEGLLQKRLDFIDVKKHGWNKYIECSADKKEIADKVNAFVEAHKDDPAWNDVFYGTTELMPSFRKAVRTVGKRAEMNREKDLAFRNQEITEKLQKQFQEAIKTHEFTPFLQTYATLFTLENDGKLTQQQKNNFSNQTDILQATFKHNEELRRQFSVTAKKMFHTIGFDHEKDVKYIAQGIREGIYPIDPQYEAQRKHQSLSALLAHTQLPSGEIMYGLNTANALLGTFEIIKQEEHGELKEDFLNNSHNMSSPEQRLEMLIYATNATDALEHCGFQSIKQPNTGIREYKKSPYNNWSVSAAKALNETVKSIKSFEKATKKTAQTAAEYYNQIMANMSNAEQSPVEFKRMMESLKAVSELKTENTPRQIIDTVQTFQHNASIYLKYAESHPEENRNIVTEAALAAVSQGNEDIYRACLTDVKMNKNIHQQKAETEQQLEAQMLTHPNENGFRRYRLFPPSAHEHKLAAADKLLIQQLKQDEKPDMEKWMNAAMTSVLDSLKESEKLLPDNSTAKTVTPQLSRVLGLSAMKSAIRAGKDENLAKIKTPEDFMKAVNVYSKMAAKLESFKNMTSDMTVAAAVQAAAKGDGKGLITAMRAVDEKAKQQNEPVRNSQFQQNGPQMNNGSQK